MLSCQAGWKQGDQDQPGTTSSRPARLAAKIRQVSGAHGCFPCFQADRLCFCKEPAALSAHNVQITQPGTFHHALLTLVLHTRSDLPDEVYAIMKKAGFLTWARSASRACKEIQALLPREVVIVPDRFGRPYSQDTSILKVPGLKEPCFVGSHSL